MSSASRPSLHDSIVAFLREHPEGVSSAEVAERFLKLKVPDSKTAAAAMRSVLASDSRCSMDQNGRWHASAKVMAGADSLAALPLMTVCALTDPGSRRLFHISLWEIVPEPSCLGAGWLFDPATLSFEERELLESNGDAPFDSDTARSLLSLVAAAGGDRIPVFLSSAARGLVAAACAQIGIPLAEDTMVVSELLRAAGIQVPRPLTLALVEQAVLGAEQNGMSARMQGERFSAVIAELVRLLGLKGIESRQDLDRSFRDERMPLFSGKAFTYDDFLALPVSPGVYGFTDKGGAYLYIGKANNLKRRLLSYFGDSDESPAKLDRLRAQSHKFIIHGCGSELESLIYEYRLIRKYLPPLNSKIEVSERKGDFRPVDDCIVLLPHATRGRRLSVWVRRDQRILLKAFDAVPAGEIPLVAELNAFFFSTRLSTEASDFPELEIATRWISRHADSLVIVPVSRLANAAEAYDALRVAWAEYSETAVFPFNLPRQAGF